MKRKCYLCGKTCYGFTCKSCYKGNSTGVSRLYNQRKYHNRNKMKDKEVI